MKLAAITFPALALGALALMGCVDSPRQNWTWIAAFEGRVLVRDDTTKVVAAVVTVEGKWKATTDFSAYHIRESVDEAESKRIAQANTLRVSVSADGFAPFDSNFSTIGLPQEQAGNDLSSSGTKWTLPVIYLKKTALDH